MRLSGLCSLLLACLCTTISADAQDYLNKLGSPPFATTLPVREGIIDVSNGNLHIEIPISSPLQRGGVLDATQKLVYDSRIWQIPPSTTSWQPNNAGPKGGWRFVTPISGTLSQLSAHQYCDTEGPSRAINTTTTIYTYVDADGVDHTFGVRIIVNNPHNNPCYDPSAEQVVTADGIALDSSGYHLFVTNKIPVVYDSSGLQVYPKVEDRNGNFLSTDASGNLVDTSGHTPVLISTTGTNTLYDVLGFGGTRNRYTATIAPVAVQTSFGAARISEYSGSIQPIQSITLPGNNGSYQFGYDSYGELNSLTLPTGGVITYDYTNFTDSYGNLNRWLSSRTEDGGTRTFSQSVLVACGPDPSSPYQNHAGCSHSVKMTSPGPVPADTVYTIALNGAAYTSNVARYSGSSSGGNTPVISEYTGYDFSLQCDPTICTGAYYVNATQSIRTLDEIGLHSIYQSTVDDPSTGNVIAEKYWDYFSGNQLGNPTKEVDHGYGYARLNAQPALTGTTELDYSSGSAVTVAQILFGYDGNVPTSTTGLPQHEATSVTRGNLTSIVPWDNTQSTNLTSINNMDDAGVVQSTDDSSGHTTIAHNSTEVFATGLISPPAAGGISLQVSESIDPSGLPNSTSDANSQITSVASYDALGRPLEIDPPIGKITFGYTPNQTSEHHYFDSGTSSETETLIDAYGRVRRVAVYNGQSSSPWYNKDTCYNTAGQVQFVSLPYTSGSSQGASVCSGPGISYFYDGLGRLIQTSTPDGNTGIVYRGRATKTTDFNNVAKITQTDSLGRLTAVCEISSDSSMPGSGAPVDCGLDISGTGFLTTYSYDPGNRKVTITQGAQQRVTQTDSLGRVIYTSEPERGETTYTYTYNSTGLLTKRTRARANQTSANMKTVTSTQMDALGRVVSSSYDDGTPARTFAYDDTTSGNAGKGRLTSYSTASTITSLVYDVMGNVHSSSQCFPGYCGQSALNASHTYDYDWANRLIQESLRVVSATTTTTELRNRCPPNTFSGTRRTVKSTQSLRT